MRAEEVPWFVSLIVSWLPFIVLVLLFVWTGRRVGRAVESSMRASDGRPVGQVLDDHLREMRRQNDLLEQALKSQGARLEALEQKP